MILLSLRLLTSICVVSVDTFPTSYHKSVHDLLIRLSLLASFSYCIINISMGEFPSYLMHRMGHLPFHETAFLKAECLEYETLTMAILNANTISKNIPPKLSMKKDPPGSGKELGTVSVILCPVLE